MAEALFRVSLGALRPVDDRADRLIARCPEGALIEVDAKFGRNLQRLRFYRKMLEITVRQSAAGKLFKTPDALHLALKWHLGLIEEVVKLDGTIAVQAKSVAFEAMEEDEFAEYVDAALQTIAEEYGIDPTTLRDEATRQAA